jgi:hypothetical protein
VTALAVGFLCMRHVLLDIEGFRKSLADHQPLFQRGSTWTS